MVLTYNKLVSAENNFSYFEITITNNELKNEIYRCKYNKNNPNLIIDYWLKQLSNVENFGYGVFPIWWVDEHINKITNFFIINKISENNYIWDEYILVEKTLESQINKILENKPEATEHTIMFDKKSFELFSLILKSQVRYNRF